MAPTQNTTIQSKDYKEINLAFYLDEYITSFVKFIIYCAEYHIKENRPRNARRYLQRSITIADGLEESMNPDIINVRARAYLKFAGFCISAGDLRTAESNLKKTLDCLMVELGVRSNKELSRKGIQYVKWRKRLGGTVKYLCMALTNYASFHRKKRELPQAVEACKLAYYIAWAFFGEKSDFTKILMANFEEIKRIYGDLVESLGEMERVLVYYKKYFMSYDIPFYVELSDKQKMINEIYRKLYKEAPLARNIKRRNQFIVDRPEEQTSQLALGYFKEINELRRQRMEREKLKQFKKAVKQSMGPVLRGGGGLLGARALSRGQSSKRSSTGRSVSMKIRKGRMRGSDGGVQRRGSRRVREHAGRSLGAKHSSFRRAKVGGGAGALKRSGFGGGDDFAPLDVNRRSRSHDYRGSGENGVGGVRKSFEAGEQVQGHSRGYKGSKPTPLTAATPANELEFPEEYNNSYSLEINENSLQLKKRRQVSSKRRQRRQQIIQNSFNERQKPRRPFVPKKYKNRRYHLKTNKQMGTKLISSEEKKPRNPHIPKDLFFSKKDLKKHKNQEIENQDIKLLYKDKFWARREKLISKNRNILPQNSFIDPDLVSYINREKYSKRLQTMKEQYLPSDIDEFFKMKIMTAPFAGQDQFEDLKHEVLFQRRREALDKLKFGRAKFNLEVDGVDLKGAYLRKFNNEFIDIEVSELRVTDKVKVQFFAIFEFS